MANGIKKASQADLAWAASRIAVVWSTAGQSSRSRQHFVKMNLLLHIIELVVSYSIYFTEGMLCI